MAYGVPYSFVPGTKAKADEVNANFIDVLTKIEDVNSRVDETNSKADTKSEELDTKFGEIENSINQRVDLNFSNISSTAQAKFDAKANASDLDGNWVGAGLQLMSSANTASNTLNQTFSLADYLPNDGKPYQIFITAAGTSSGFGSYNLSGGYNTFEFFRTVKEDFATSVILVVSSAHNITVKAGALTSGTNKFSLYIGAYRRVR